jgi:hypothetical protein
MNDTADSLETALRKLTLAALIDKARGKPPIALDGAAAVGVAMAAGLPVKLDTACEYRDGKMHVTTTLQTVDRCAVFIEDGGFRIFTAPG